MKSHLPVGQPGWRAPQDIRGARVHLVGIGGSGMAGLAAMLLRRGARVSGSDRSTSGATARLQAAGARMTGHGKADAVPSDVQLVVASAAIPDDHPELVAAHARGVPVFKYARLLGTLMGLHDGIAVAGTHGKSTTTAWLAYTLRQAGLEPSYVVGADCDQLGGGSGVGDGRHFIAEACEFDESFLNLRPKTAVVLNIDEDHLDYYRDLDAIEAAFARFAALVPPDGFLLVNADDPRCNRVAARRDGSGAAFGLSETADWRAVDLELRGGRYACSIACRGSVRGRVTLGLAGRHNVYNALAVAALASNAGLEWPSIAGALETFHGARRRMELRGSVNGAVVLDDYAHHPVEIRATLSAIRDRFEPRRLWCVFQPHQHSRTRFLLDAFAASFSAADRVVVPDIFFVRDSQRERELVSADDLVERIRALNGVAAHIPDFAEIADRLAREVEPGDVVVTMGAGDIWKVADELVQRLRADLPS